MKIIGKYILATALSQMFTINVVAQENKVLIVDYSQRPELIALIECNCFRGEGESDFLEFKYDMVEEIYGSWLQGVSAYLCSKATGRDFPQRSLIVYNDSSNLLSLEGIEKINKFHAHIHDDLSLLEKVIMILSLSEWQGLRIYLEKNLNIDIKVFRNIQIINNVDNRRIETIPSANIIQIHSQNRQYRSTRNPEGYFKIIWEYDPELSSFLNIEVQNGW